MSKSKNEKWEKQKKAAKATQIAFELEQTVALRIRELAAQEGLTPSDQIRKLVGLSYTPPKRPRLTVSLTQDDYKQLGEKYKLDQKETLEIKRQIMEELIEILK